MQIEVGEETLSEANKIFSTGGDYWSTRRRTGHHIDWTKKEIPHNTDNQNTKSTTKKDY